MKKYSRKQGKTRFPEWILVSFFVWMVCFGGVAMGSDSAKSAGETSELGWKYPDSPRGDHVDNYHGTEVADPYRWLEDPDSDATKAWVDSQNELTFSYLEQTPQRQALEQRLTKLWNYERYGIPTQRGGRYFFTKNDGLQNQSVLYTVEDLSQEPRELLDPNQLSEDGTVALASYAPSDNGRYLAYGLASGGSDWREWRVRDVETGQDLDDHLKWVKFSGISWTPDNQGFFYSRYDEPEGGNELVDVNYYQKLYYHRLGESQEDDQLIYQRSDQKEWGFSGTVSEDGRWLIISVWRGTDPKNLVFYRDLEKPDTPVQELISEFEAEYRFLGNEGSVLWFLTDWEAPKRRVIAVDVARAEKENWTSLVPEAAEVIESANVIGGRFFVNYLQDAHSRVEIHGPDGAHQRTLPLPGVGSVSGPAGRQSDQETFYAYTSFTAPTTIYCYDIPNEETTVFRQPELEFEPEDYTTEQVFYSSPDGTRVPMFLTYKKGLKRDGNNPTLLYGYGGFDISITPSFRVQNLVWLEMGGIYAVPNLRGGGEYGREWHEAGMRDRKQNVFDDFIAAAEWLIENRYTSPQRLAISGRSNGGLLVGACMTQRPELFAATLPGVGVLDMLRFHKFTIGWAWVSEYGSADVAEDFPFIHAYSPLHNLRQGTSYPATLITTADHDDRVVPAHSFKFAAALQAAQEGDRPTLIRIETRAGHGAGTPTSKRIEQAADELGFLLRELDMELPSDFTDEP